MKNFLLLSESNPISKYITSQTVNIFFFAHKLACFRIKKKWIFAWYAEKKHKIKDRKRRKICNNYLFSFKNLKFVFSKPKENIKTLEIFRAKFLSNIQCSKGIELVIKNFLVLH